MLICTQTHPQPDCQDDWGYQMISIFHRCVIHGACVNDCKRCQLIDRCTIGDFLLGFQVVASSPGLDVFMQIGTLYCLHCILVQASQVSWVCTGCVCRTGKWPNYTWNAGPQTSPRAHGQSKRAIAYSNRIAWWVEQTDRLGISAMGDQCHRDDGACSTGQLARQLWV